MKRHKSLQLKPIKGVYQTSQNHKLSTCRPGECFQNYLKECLANWSNNCNYYDFRINVILKNRILLRLSHTLRLKVTSLL